MTVFHAIRDFALGLSRGFGLFLGSSTPTASLAYVPGLQKPTN